MRGNVSPSWGSICLRRVRKNFRVASASGGCERIHFGVHLFHGEQKPVLTHPPEADATRRVLFKVLVAILFISFAATAQPIPKLTSISPKWIQRGATVEIILVGANLSRINEFAFSGEEGVSAIIAPPSKPAVRLESSGANIFSTGAVNDDKRLTAKLTVASETALGSQEIRVISPDGVSNPLTVRITDTPEILESGGKHSLTNAQEISLPVGINGKVGEADQTDFFKLKAKKGEHFILDVQANRLGSALDSSLAILDSTGKEVVRNEDANGFDSFIQFQVPADGEFFVTLRDFQHRGGDPYNYHLTIGAIPYLESFFPFGGQRGKPVDLALSGVNLDGAEQMKLSIDANAPSGPQEIRAHTAKGISNARQFEVSLSPDFFEMEPNDTATNATSISLPGNANGQIAKENDVDVFKFKVEKGQRFIFEIFARRFGARLDPLLTLTDAKGNVLQQNDDAMGADARIDQTFSEAGEYFISVRDLLRRGGDNFGYRLSATPPPRPDFSAKILTDTVRLNRGGRTIARVEVTRSGVDSGIEIVAEDLPDGVTCSPLIIPAEFPTGLLCFNATDAAKLGSVPLELKAVAAINGKRETRALQSVSGSKPTARDKRGRERKVTGRTVGAAYLTVLEPAPFTVDWVTLAANVEQNQSTKVFAEVERRPGFSGEVKISVEGFSAGNDPSTKSLEVSAAAVPTNMTRAEISLKAKMDSETGTRPIFVRGEGTVNGQPVVEFSRPMALRISEFPFVLENSLPRLAVTTPAPGVTNATASEAEFSVKTQRRGLFSEEIHLTLEGLPEGVAASSTNLLRGVTEANFKLNASAKTKPGTNTLTVLGTAEVNGRKFELRAPGIQFIVNPAPEIKETAAAK